MLPGQSGRHSLPDWPFLFAKTTLTTVFLRILIALIRCDDRKGSIMNSVQQQRIALVPTGTLLSRRHADDIVAALVIPDGLQSGNPYPDTKGVAPSFGISRGSASEATRTGFLASGMACLVPVKPLFSKQWSFSQATGEYSETGGKPRTCDSVQRSRMSRIWTYVLVIICETKKAEIVCTERRNSSKTKQLLSWLVSDLYSACV